MIMNVILIRFLLLSPYPIILMHIQSLKTIAEILKKCQTIEDYMNLIDDFCTADEVRKIADRMLIVQSLKSGETPEKTSYKLGIPLEEAYRGQRILSSGSGAAKSFT